MNEPVTIPDQAREAAAKATYEADRRPGDIPWEEQSDGYRATWREVIGAGLEAAAPAIQAPLLQAMWDALGYLGFDLDGDPTPAVAGGVEAFIENFLGDVCAHRKDYDELLDES